MKSGRVDQTRMRSANMSLILRHLRTHGSRTRARLAAETGLSKATMSSLVADLVERRLVYDGGVERVGEIGRPGTSIALDDSHVIGVGLEINVDYLALTSLDLCGKSVHDSLSSLDVAGLPVTEVLDRISDLIAGELRRLEENGREVVAIGIAAPGIIDVESGTVRFAPNLGWRGVPIAAELADRLGPLTPPILLENDAKLGAIGEHTALDGQPVDDLVYLTGDVGVGAGIIEGGRLLRGWTGFAGEVGHLSMAPDGRRCNCGRIGCWETLIGLPAFLRLAAPEDRALRDPSQRLEDRLRTLRSRADAGDEQTVAALASIGADLARGISVLVDVLNPRSVVLGGYFSWFGDYLREPITSFLEARQIEAASGAVVTFSTLGLHSATRGGAHHALATVFDDPTLVAPSTTHQPR